MKKLLLTTAMVMGAFLFMNETKAQVRFNVNVNIGGRPNWGLIGNYAGDYYYLPEIDTYYDIPHRQFIYFDGGDWNYANELPYAYRGYDLYHGYKVVVNEPRPYLHGNVYRDRYRSYYNTYRQPVIVAQRPYYPNYRIDNDRYNRGREDDRFNRGREYDRDDHYERGRGNERGHDNDRGKDNDRGGNRRGRG